jgi:chemotaxis protein histidine kinase CheA
LQNALKSAGENFTDELFKEESLIILEQLAMKTRELTDSLAGVAPEVKSVIEPIATKATVETVAKEIHIPEQTEIEPLESIDSAIIEFIENSKESISEIKELAEKFSKFYNPDALNKMLSGLNAIKAHSGLLGFKNINKIIRAIEDLLEHHKFTQKMFDENASLAIEQSIIVLYAILDGATISGEDVEFKADTNDLCDMLENLITGEINLGINADEYYPPREKKPPVVEQEPPTPILSPMPMKAEGGLDLFSLATKMEDLFKKIEKDENDYDAINQLVDSLKILSEDDFIKNNSELNDVVISIITIVESVAAKEINAGAIISVIKSDVRILSNHIKDKFKAAEPLVEAKEVKPEHTVQDNAPIVMSMPEAQKAAETKNIKEFVRPESEKAQSAERKEVRVSTDKLNKLFDLVGEIITIESMVVNNKNLQGLKLPDFQIASGMLNKLIRELQKITMSIRMIPLEGLFNKMSRLVRDLSRKFGKTVELEINGQETEMDKNVIEQLSDPLVHMIRNSIDHGIESEHVRLDAGKNPNGKVILGASYQGNEIHITIEDDGAGLNRTKILEKAQSRGLFAGNPAELTDKQVWQFIFEPGLSTAKEVTDVSGRGVGMDVVKKNIEKLRGSIDIESKSGFGTKITFRIPLTLAIMDAMLVRVGNSKYALPILSVRESFQPKYQDITKTMDGIEVVKVRNELYPVIRLHELMRKEPDNYDLDKGILMMLSSHDKKACLLVDEILGQQQAVVKPLSSYIGDVQGVTGCMVMADGKIGLILDVESLILKAENFVN